MWSPRSSILTHIHVIACHCTSCLASASALRRSPTSNRLRSAWGPSPKGPSGASIVTCFSRMFHGRFLGALRSPSGLRGGERCQQHLTKRNPAALMQALAVKNVEKLDQTCHQTCHLTKRLSASEKYDSRR